MFVSENGFIRFDLDFRAAVAVVVPGFLFAKLEERARRGRGVYLICRG